MWNEVLDMAFFPILQGLTESSTSNIPKFLETRYVFTQITKRTDMSSNQRFGSEVLNFFIEKMFYQSHWVKLLNFSIK